MNKEYKYMVDIKVKRLFPDAKLPLKAKPEDIGYDLFTHRVEDCGNYIKIYSGIAIAPIFGYYTELAPRSSIYKYGLIVYNSIGQIENQYRGEIVGILYKTNDFKELPKPGERLLQLVVKEQLVASLIEVESLPETARGKDGFGSTGRN